MTCGAAAVAANCSTRMFVKVSIKGADSPPASASLPFNHHRHPRRRLFQLRECFNILRVPSSRAAGGRGDTELWGARKRTVVAVAADCTYAHVCDGQYKRGRTRPLLVLVSLSAVITRECGDRGVVGFEGKGKMSLREDEAMREDEMMRQTTVWIGRRL